MKTAVLTLALLPVLAGVPAIAQPPQTPQQAAQQAQRTQQALAAAQVPPLEDFKPSTLNQQGKQYPEVNSERRVRARVVAPQAQSVLLDLGGVRYPMTKGADGAWIGVSAPQDEGFHYYQINVDGAQVPDPGSLFFYGASRWGSGVEVPANDQDFYALRDVPHGNLQQVFFTIGDDVPNYGAGSLDANLCGSMTAFLTSEENVRSVILIRQTVKGMQQFPAIKKARKNRGCC